MYFFTADGGLYCVNPNGSLAWAAEVILGSPFSPSASGSRTGAVSGPTLPAALDEPRGVIYFTAGTVFYAVSTQAGSVLWSYALPATVTAPFSIRGDRIFFATADHHVSCLSVAGTTGLTAPPLMGITDPAIRFRLPVVPPGMFKFPVQMAAQLATEVVTTAASASGSATIAVASLAGIAGGSRVNASFVARLPGQAAANSTHVLATSTSATTTPAAISNPLSASSPTAVYVSSLAGIQVGSLITAPELPTGAPVQVVAIAAPLTLITEVTTVLGSASVYLRAILSPSTAVGSSPPAALVVGSIAVAANLPEGTVVTDLSSYPIVFLR